MFEHPPIGSGGRSVALIYDDRFEVRSRPLLEPGRMQRLDRADNYCVRKVCVTAGLFSGGHNSRGAFQLVDCLIPAVLIKNYFCLDGQPRNCCAWVGFSESEAERLTPERKRGWMSGAEPPMEAGSDKENRSH
jgi:hypothetical protein